MCSGQPHLCRCHGACLTPVSIPFPTGEGRLPPSSILLPSPAQGCPLLAESKISMKEVTLAVDKAFLKHAKETGKTGACFFFFFLPNLFSATLSHFL